MLRLRLLGGFHIEQAGRVELSRLPSRAATALLARLALQPHRQHPREELVELLWPGVALEPGRNRLRQTLSTLRALLETPEAPLFLADRAQLSLLPGALATDVAEFEAALGRDAPGAAALYGGELLPGHFDDWIVAERHRLAALAERLPSARAAAAPVPRTARLSEPAGPALPRYLTRYFEPPGRLDALAASLPQHPLLTLIGPGGVGKTRLAVELAWRQHRELGWRCAHAALAEARDDAALLATLAQALTPTPGGGWPAVEAAVRELDLLVLDNAEQAIAAVARAAQRLLQAAPRLRILVTSRHALALDGETLVELAPLSGAADPALALFIDRARAVRADFHASRDNQAALTELIAALDGLPLALELAAARVRSFSPAQMLSQWQSLLAMPGSLPAWLSSPTRAPRHASVDGLLGWSLQLLDGPPRELLACLATLPGAFALDDVLALGGNAGLLDELVGHSLVQTDTEAEPRYRLLELLRQSVLARVDAGLQRQARHRLRAVLCTWAEGLGHRAPLADWAPRRGQARALIASAAADEDAATGLRLALAMRPCWESDGVDRLLVDQLGALLQAEPQSAGHELRAHLAFTHGDRALALAEAERALVLAGTDPADRARALVRRAWVLLAGDGSEQGQSRHLDEAIALARRADDGATEARAWQQLAAVVVSRNQPAQAEAMFARAQELWEQVGHGRQAAARLRNRAQCLIELGEVATAVAWIAATQRQAEADGDAIGQLDAAYSLALAHEKRRDWAAALAAAQQALRIAHARQHLHARALTLLLFGRPLARLRQPERALQLAAFAERYWLSHLGALVGREARALARLRRLAGLQLSADLAATATARGQTMELAEALALALA
jgi:predicted ATPase